MGFFGVFGVEYHLQQAASVAQVDEYQVAVVAPSVNPTGNRYLRSNRSFAGLSAVRVLVHSNFLFVRSVS
jgi:hypothetical protein